MLALFTVLHFLVDGICGAALAVYAVNQPFLEPIVYYFGLYNAFAFGTQWLTGYLFDRRPDRIRRSFLFAALLLSAGSVASFGIAFQAVLLGTGNSIFHAAAGSWVLRRYQTYKELGIFVSGGAVGLGLGLNGIVGPYPFAAACIVLSAAAVRLLPGAEAAVLQPMNVTADVRAGAVSGTGFRTGDSLTGAAAVSLILLLGCVVLRGLGSGNADAPYAMLFPCVFAAGKALGGILCDKAGYRKSILFIFLLCFAALQFSGLVSSVLLVLAFNMTMPLTLRLAHWCNPGYPGLMFGLAAACLLPGVYYRDFSLAPQAMAVLQFLCLSAAGYLLRKQAGRPEIKEAG